MQYLFSQMIVNISISYHSSIKFSKLKDWNNFL